MPFTANDYLPSLEELTVPEIQLSSAALRAGGIHFGKYCDDVSKDYMLCLRETEDIRKCVNEGKAVTRCGFEFFGKVKQNCHDEFNQYFKCLDHSPTESLSSCRRSQQPFDICMEQKLGIERPPKGYFAVTRLHKTDRPKPDRVTIKYPEIPMSPGSSVDPQKKKASGDRFPLAT